MVTGSLSGLWTSFRRVPDSSSRKDALVWPRRSKSIARKSPKLPGGRGGGGRRPSRGQSLRAGASEARDAQSRAHENTATYSLETTRTQRRTVSGPREHRDTQDRARENTATHSLEPTSTQRYRASSPREHNDAQSRTHTTTHSLQQPPGQKSGALQ